MMALVTELRKKSEGHVPSPRTAGSALIQTHHFSHPLLSFSHTVTRILEKTHFTDGSIEAREERKYSQLLPLRVPYPQKYLKLLHVYIGLFLSLFPK